ncbi:acyltransferase family protein [Novosphingobium sp. ZW T3_23]|uniref:acyltransferase family protein n=1 Tax=Novosphingobium sp. ZW T3_23 TaxID=3378084 RepID=UPI0038554D86
MNRAKALETRPGHKRIAWLEACKGLGIILLVVLHVCADSKSSMSPEIVWFLRLFRMPMFFVVSGLLFSVRPPMNLVERKFLSIIVPYIAFLALILALISLRSILFHVPNPYLTRAGVKAVILGGEYLKSDFGVFWFMTCLFFTQILYNAMLLRWKTASNPRLVAVVILIYVCGYALWLAAPGLPTPWAIGVVPFGLPFLWFGNLMKEGRIGLRGAWLLCIAVIAVSLMAGIFGTHFRMDLKYAEPGPPLIGMALAIAITWLFFQLMKVICLIPWLPRPLEVIGASSMTVMFLHQFVHFSLRQAGIGFEPLLIFAGVTVPMVFWFLVRQAPWASALFLGTATPGAALRHLRLG